MASSSIIPWRIRYWVSENYPLVYHLLASGSLGRNSQAHWDDELARTWNDPNRSWPTIHELIASNLDPSAVLLDIGCGTGSLLRALRDRGFTRTHGLEFSAYAVRRLIQEGVDVHYGPLPKLPFPPDVFDAVVLSQVLEHVVRRHTLLKEMKRVLTPGGKLFVAVPDDSQGPLDEPEHVIKYNKTTLHELLAMYFEVHSVNSVRDANHNMSYLFAVASKPR